MAEAYAYDEDTINASRGAYAYNIAPEGSMTRTQQRIIEFQNAIDQLFGVYVEDLARLRDVRDALDQAQQALDAAYLAAGDAA